MSFLKVKLTLETTKGTNTIAYWYTGKKPEELHLDDVLIAFPSYRKALNKGSMIVRYTIMEVARSLGTIGE